MKSNVKTVEASSNKQIIKKSKWQLIMRLFSKCCHQDPKRSFFIGKFQLPICARCLGMSIGYIIGIVLNACQLFMPSSFAISLLTLGMIDWIIQNQLYWYHNNWTRLFSGIFLGIGIIYLITNFVLIIIAVFL